MVIMQVWSPPPRSIYVNGETGKQASEEYIVTGCTEGHEENSDSLQWQSRGGSRLPRAAGKAPRGRPLQETPEGLEEASFGESLEKFPGQRERLVQKPQGEEWAGGQQGCS